MKFSKNLIFIFLPGLIFAQVLETKSLLTEEIRILDFGQDHGHSGTTRFKSKIVDPVYYFSLLYPPSHVFSF